MTTTKGFTLIELLIVIGILAILATTVVLVLNPAQILQETRDTQRISDLGSINSAIGLYLATASSIDMAVVGQCRGATGAVNWWATRTGTVNPYTAFAAPETGITQHANIARTVDGNGWVPVNLALVSGGSPLAALPIDPTNTGTNLLTTGDLFYTYTCGGTGNGTTFEIDANMESAKFDSGGGGSDVESTDGGNQPLIYEVGNAANLTL